jgi:hypothetical protein
MLVPMKLPMLLLSALLLAGFSDGMSCNCSTANIRSAVMAEGYADGKPVNPTSTFAPTAEKFYLVASLGNAPPGTKVTGEWWYLEGAPQKVDSASVEVGSGDAVFFLTRPASGNWPVGHYAVDVWIAGKEDKKQRVTFEVK